MKYSELDDSKLSALIDNRWQSSATLWTEIEKITKKNKKVYSGNPEWWTTMRIPPTRPKVTANRIFTDAEAVINSLIANPPKPNTIPARDSEESKELSLMLEKVLNVRYNKLNVKEVLRQGLRDLFISRIIVLKPYWDVKINDFNVRRVDPTKVRFSKKAKNEVQSEFAIEEIETTVQELIDTFPEKRKEILAGANISDEQLLIDNPETTYKEAWIGYDLCVKFKDKILYKGKNPYWDWDGILATKDEMMTLQAKDNVPLRDKLKSMESKLLSDLGPLEEGQEDTTVQEYRMKDEENAYESYLFNYFDVPRKPYIFATVLGNEDRPIGMTSFIEQASSLQEVVDRLVYQIYLNTEMVNGITKVNTESGISKSDAQGIRYDAGGVLWGKDVVKGVQREFGQGLPQFVFEALKDYRDEIDNIMAASSAFRGEREGQETKAGRIALIEQSFLRLNELVQTVDYVMQELFTWWMQLMKVKYTERHYIKEFGPDQAVEIMELTRNDIEDGIEVRVIPGKMLPEDKQFMYERAQTDFQAGLLSPIDYMTEAGYQNPKELAKNSLEFQQNPMKVLGMEEPMIPGQPMQPPAVPPAQIPQVSPIP
jgi:hypothetical protein